MELLIWTLCHRDLEKLSNCKWQAEAQSGEVANTHHRDGGSSHEEKGTKVARRHKFLDGLKRHRASNSEHEGAKRLQEPAGKEWLTLNCSGKWERLSVRDNQARIELRDLPTEIKKESAEADVELVRVMQKKEQTKNMMKNLRRKKRVRTTLWEPCQRESRREGRWELIHEFEGKHARTVRDKEIKEKKKSELRMLNAFHPFSPDNTC